MTLVDEAAYDALADGSPLQMRHLYDPIANEFRKLGHEVDPTAMLARGAASAA